MAGNVCCGGPIELEIVFDSALFELPHHVERLGRELTANVVLDYGKDIGKALSIADHLARRLTAPVDPEHPTRDHRITLGLALALLRRLNTIAVGDRDHSGAVYQASLKAAGTPGGADFLIPCLIALRHFLREQSLSWGRTDGVLNRFEYEQIGRELLAHTLDSLEPAKRHLAYELIGLCARVTYRRRSDATHRGSV